MTANLIKIESTPDLVEQVYASLLDAISDGSLPPGARIMQEDLAAQLADGVQQAGVDLFNQVGC